MILFNSCYLVYYCNNFSYDCVHSTDVNITASCDWRRHSYFALFNDPNYSTVPDWPVTSSTTKQSLIGQVMLLTTTQSLIGQVTLIRELVWWREFQTDPSSRQSMRPCDQAGLQAI